MQWNPLSYQNQPNNLLKLYTNILCCGNDVPKIINTTHITLTPIGFLPLTIRIKGGCKQMHLQQQTQLTHQTLTPSCHLISQKKIELCKELIFLSVSFFPKKSTNISFYTRDHFELIQENLL